MVCIINVYGPQDVDGKNVLWSKINAIMESIDAAWCVFVDFSEARRPEERLISSKGASDLNDFIHKGELTDIPLGGKRFTRICDNWIKFRKIDRF